MKLSIIVPVYNVELFLEKCIQSVFDQDIPHETYEIVAVNDGSTDNSPAILEKLQKTISNLKIIHQDNKGLSGARNSGFDFATGDYLLCVDSDDYILPNSLHKLISLAEEHQLDLLEFGAQGVDEDKNVIYSLAKSSNGKVFTGEQYLTEIRYMGSACNKLYNRNFLNTHKLRFMEGVYIEDIEFNTRVVFKANKVLATDYIAAHFLQRLGSITRTKNFAKKEKMIFDIHTVLKSINDFTENEVTENSSAYIPLKRRVSSLIATLLIRVLKDSKTTSTKKEIIKKLKEDNLYPTKYEAETKDKKYFLNFSNIYPLFSIGNFFCSTYNRIRYGK
ncbi:glycosyltransferase [uncultured Aquimarina sp.]|uniref:glycosyltransferase family 2 protein n=1 Tax=uncultured Aquimarina sp. TaxID=575652 RepID=UPI0026170DCA|nr:glycosyltransferase [uncultured Aquimarina sp.]